MAGSVFTLFKVRNALFSGEPLGNARLDLSYHLYQQPTTQEPRENMESKVESEVDSIFSKDDDSDSDGSDSNDVCSDSELQPRLIPEPMQHDSSKFLPTKLADITLKHLLDHGRVSAGDVVFVHRNNNKNPRAGVIMSDGSIALGDEFRTSCTITSVNEFRKYIDPIPIPNLSSWLQVFVQLSAPSSDYSTPGSVYSLFDIKEALFCGKPLGRPRNHDIHLPVKGKNDKGGGGGGGAVASTKAKNHLLVDLSHGSKAPPLLDPRINFGRQPAAVQVDSHPPPRPLVGLPPLPPKGTTKPFLIAKRTYHAAAETTINKTKETNKRNVPGHHPHSQTLLLIIIGMLVAVRCGSLH